jgi:glyoxylase-like metal-dependent hydrolase (beta-lactamase superfamily II)
VQAAFLGVRPPDVTDVDHLLKEGYKLSWGGFEAQIIHTPGHTPGSVCLYLANNEPRTPSPSPNSTILAPKLFAGDTLFAGSIGRTDLWGGSMEQIMESLRGKLMQLPDETLVYPGHGVSTTIGEERATNPFLLTES